MHQLVSNFIDEQINPGKDEAAVDQGVMAVTFATIVLLASALQISSASQQPHTKFRPYNATRVKQMIQAAHTPEAYMQLADYFGAEARFFDEKSAKDEQELTGLLAARYHAKTYETQLDGTRNMIQSDHAKAASYRTQADRYRMWARSAAAESEGTPTPMQK